MTKVAYRRILVGGIEIFYGEAGCSNTPALLLLHGFPSASHMFRDLILMLAEAASAARSPAIPASC
jgi:hypothetical protein